jgi:hypothetical protein
VRYRLYVMCHRRDRASKSSALQLGCPPSNTYAPGDAGGVGWQCRRYKSVSWSFLPDKHDSRRLVTSAIIESACSQMQDRDECGGVDLFAVRDGELVPAPETNALEREVSEEADQVVVPDRPPESTALAIIESACSQMQDRDECGGVDLFAVRDGLICWTGERGRLCRSGVRPRIGTRT